jgi:hypothetical protein
VGHARLALLNGRGGGDVASVDIQLLQVSRRDCGFTVCASLKRRADRVKVYFRESCQLFPLFVGQPSGPVFLSLPSDGARTTRSAMI